MVSISPSSLIGKFTNIGWVKKGCQYCEKNPAKAAMYATLASLVGKDAVGCYLYVTQSLNNKRIPDDKRRFVASMDLANGILNIISQIAFTFGINKLNKPIFNKLFKKSFSNEAFKELATKLRLMQKDADVKVLRKLSIREDFEGLKGTCFKNFENVVNIIAATILAKRVFVPFVSTPMAQYFTNKVDAKKAKKLGMTLDEYQKQQKEAAKNGKSVDDSTPKSSDAPAMKGAPRQIDIVSSSESTNLLDKYKRA